jgi:hypothetical protein
MMRFHITLPVFASMLAVLLPILSEQVLAQHDDQSVEEYVAMMTVRRELVIVGSTPDYTAARRIAGNAARRLGMPLDLRGLHRHRSRGLTLSSTDCDQSGWSYPCYLPRGREHDSMYVSIEHSSAYSELRPDLYIVVIANGPVSSTVTTQAKSRAAAFFPDVYSRSVAVYMGCIH